MGVKTVMVTGDNPLTAQYIAKKAGVDAAIQAAIAAGYDEALLYDRKPKTLSEMEKLMGKAEFAEKIGGYVTKPLGKPTLALSTDKREAYNPAATDFAGVAANE